ncbi:anti-sigma factor antagonist [Peptoniphilus equinus]|uniref:Anti-sigma factor antagonist n=1 Tax=Peptoniphilus equinus TaxID=3016343 RepID=A0ABY7QTD2_9FIRM|nr:anti-sigma factor antagonist [Peptoniphilus equinus]WBW49992.1 anti-sigma factor antagonist [Peptoniphilus equinus]
MAFTVKFENKDTWIIMPQGELDISATEGFKNDVIQNYNEDKKDLLLDFKDLDYLDSTGLGSLISILNTIKDDGHTVTIQNVKPSIKKLFVITKLDTVFKIGD